MLMSRWHFLPVVAGLFLANIFPALGQEFPDGPGKQVVTAVCGGCHDINRIRVGYTPEGWRTVVRMMQNVETPVPADQWDSVTEYLIKSFPERPRPAAVVLSGPAEAVIKEWPVPTPGSRPHDPLATRDGAIWWTGQLANKLGRLDPKTGAMKEYDLKTPHTGPHGLSRRQGRQHLVHGQQRGVDRQARSKDRRRHRVSDARLPRRRTRILSSSIATAFCGLRYSRPTW